MPNENLIPDFDTMIAHAEEAAKLRAKEIILKSELQCLEAICVREAILNREYWLSDKPPSMSFCDAVVKVIGNTEEERSNLENLRNELAAVTEQMVLLESLMYIDKNRLDLYRTLCANERTSMSV